jgi:hypothetical protein
MQLVNVGLHSLLLYIPPPLRAELPLNIQFESIGLLAFKLQIAPPHRVIELFLNMQFDSVGLLAS